MYNWQPVEYDSLPGWQDDDHEAAFSCFRVSAKALRNHQPSTRKAVEPDRALLEIADKALALEPDKIGTELARRFFEEHFEAKTIPGSKGFVTGYFEPELAASRIRTNNFDVPVYGRPEDLIEISKSDAEPNLPDEYEFGRKQGDRVVEYFDRKQIEEGALAGRCLERFWLKSPIDAFFHAHSGICASFVTGWRNHPDNLCWKIRPSLHVDRQTSR